MNLLRRNEQDRKLFRRVRLVMTRAERLWLLDCEGDYETYRLRLQALARDYGISVSEEK